MLSILLKLEKIPIINSGKLSPNLQTLLPALSKPLAPVARESQINILNIVALDTTAFSFFKPKIVLTLNWLPIWLINSSLSPLPLLGSPVDLDNSWK